MLSSDSIRELILKTTSLKQLSTLFSAISQHTTSSTNESNQFVAIKASVEVASFVLPNPQLLCTVDLDASANQISELVQTICLEMDDLSGDEIPAVMGVFMQYFDFEGKKMGSHAEYPCVALCIVGDR